MINFDLAKKNMLDCQLETNGITDEKLIEAIALLPREMFLEEIFRPAAYLDEDIVIDGELVLMEPMVLSQMVQALSLNTDDYVLAIGDRCGYATALVSLLSSAVVSIEEKPGDMDIARGVWVDHNCCNIAVSSGTLDSGYQATAPYNAIIVAGALDSVPDTLLSSISNGGRLVCVIRDNERCAGRITLFEKSDNSHVSSRVIGNANTPFLYPGKVNDNEFVF